MVFMYQGQSLSGGGSGADENVKQVPTSSGSNYEVLFSGGANNTEETNYARKTNAFRYSPDAQSIYLGFTANNGNTGISLDGLTGSIKSNLNSTDYVEIGQYGRANAVFYKYADGVTYGLVIDSSDIAINRGPLWDGDTTSLKNAISLTAKKSNITEEFDPFSAYAVGDYCIKDNILYICTTAVTGDGSNFNPGDWTATSVTTELKSKANKSESISNITRNGTTFTATKADGTTFTFSQQDNNTTYAFATGDSNGQIKVTPSGGTAQNVSVKGLAAAAYKGVFARSSVGDIGWGTEANRTKVLEVNAIAFWNGRHSGTSSNLQYCDRGRFGTIVTKNTGDYLPINPENIEFTNNAWHFLDFHWQGSKDDYTARIIEEAKGTVRIYYRLKVNESYMVLNQYGGYRMYHGGSDLVCQMRSGGTGVIEFLQTSGYGTWATCKAKAFSVQSSKWIKENINDLTEEEALKLLNLRPVTFDYTDGVTKNCRGLIAEEAYEELPYCVDMPEEYLNLDHDPILKADKDEDTDIGILPSIDYSKFVPHLIKLCQIQQKQIDELTEKVTQLEASGFKFEV